MNLRQPPAETKMCLTGRTRTRKQMERQRKQRKVKLKWFIEKNTLWSQIQRLLSEESTWVVMVGWLKSGGTIKQQNKKKKRVVLALIRKDTG